MRTPTTTRIDMMCSPRNYGQLPSSLRASLYPANERCGIHGYFKCGLCSLRALQVRERKLKTITRVTVTGADDSVSPKDLAELAAKFPFVEIGVLLHKELKGTQGFPSDAWLNDLAAYFHESDMMGKGMISFSGHICGSLLEDIFEGRWPYATISGNFSAIARRWQFNNRGSKHHFDPQGLLRVVEEQNRLGKEVIFQFDGATRDALFLCRTVGLNVSAVFDSSHGTGSLPASWPRAIPGVPYGYAGGLSPENAADQYVKIAVAAEERPVWLDAETSLRSEDDQRFDVAKVDAFLSALAPWLRDRG